MDSTQDNKASVCISETQLEPDVKTLADTDQKALEPLDIDIAEGGYSGVNREVVGCAPFVNRNEEDDPEYSEPQEFIMKYVRSEEDADLRINIGGFSALVVSGVVCHHSPVLKFMCTQHLKPKSTPPGAPAFQLDHFEYTPPPLMSADDVTDHAIAVLNIRSEQCWVTDECTALSIVLGAMHGNGTDLPHKDVKMETMGNVAEFTWAYSCEEVMVPWFRIWFDNPTIYGYLDNLLFNPEDANEQLAWFASAITVAFVMKDVTALECLLKIFVLLIPSSSEFTKELKSKGLATQILEKLQGSILKARMQNITKLTSILHHIYDIYVGKLTPQTSAYIDMSGFFLGPCRYGELGLLLCALENQLPSTGFLLNNSANMSLSQVLNGLYSACSAIKQMRKDSSSKCTTFIPKTDYHRCANPSWFLMHAIVELQSSIEVHLEDGSGISVDDKPLAALVTPKDSVKDLVKRFQILYSEHVHHIFISPNDGWKYLCFQQWLSKVAQIEMEDFKVKLLPTDSSSEDDEWTASDDEGGRSSTSSFPSSPSPIRNRK